MTEPTVVKIKSRDKNQPVETVPVFEIDDVVYSMPARVPGSIALQLIERMAEEGELVAVIWAFRKVLGDEAYEALRDCDDVEPEQMTEILDGVSDRILGVLEESGKGQGQEHGRSPGYSPMNGTSGRTSGRSTGSRRKKR